MRTADIDSNPYTDYMLRVKGYLTSANSDVPSSQPSQSFDSSNGDASRRNVSGFKIMTVTRGYTEEADKLLDYLVCPSFHVYMLG